jgi:hypothetical protein
LSARRSCILTQSGRESDAARKDQTTATQTVFLHPLQNYSINAAKTPGAFYKLLARKRRQGKGLGSFLEEPN